MIVAFPKIFSIGIEYIRNIFSDDVEITEKIDGSQFVFGKLNGELFIRSKGKEMVLDAPEKMFDLAVDFIKRYSNRIPDNYIFYCEYMRTPHHNILSYTRIPKNNLILFGVSTLSMKFENEYWKLENYADNLGIDVVPCIFKGRVESADFLLTLLEKESILGGTKIEGVVVKNYNRQLWLGDIVIPIMCGKFVSENFKEVHKRDWGKEHSPKGTWLTYIEEFRTEPRWLKAIQHLKEKGELELSPRDIGKLIKEIQRDIQEEEKENIKEFLWKNFGDNVLRKSISGFPEWYKEYIMKKSFEKLEN